MEQLNQLMQMRDAALERLKVNPDFKLANSLDALISDLETFVSETGESGVVEPGSDDGDQGYEETDQEPDGIGNDDGVDGQDSKSEARSNAEDQPADGAAFSAGDDSELTGAAQIDQGADEMLQAVESELENTINEEAKPDDVALVDIDQLGDELNEELNGDLKEEIDVGLDDEATAAIEALEAELSLSGSGDGFSEADSDHNAQPQAKNYH
jgi:hypothetical protein